MTKPIDARVLILEDDVGLLELYKLSLEPLIQHIDTAATLDSASAFLEKEHYHLFISDVQIHGQTVERLLARHQKIFKDNGTLVAIISAMPGNYSLTKRVGADFFMTKPISPQALRAFVQDALGE